MSKRKVIATASITVAVCLLPWVYKVLYGVWVGINLFVD